MDGWMGDQVGLSTNKAKDVPTSITLTLLTPVLAICPQVTPHTVNSPDPPTPRCQGKEEKG